jgi:uncharacterized protein (TIGR03437 family)
VPNQTVSSATYNFGANGSGTLNIPLGGGAADQRLVGGEKVVYTSSTGDLVIGGSGERYDMFIAFKAPATASNALYSGTYVMGSLFMNFGNGFVYSSYGSTRALGDGSEIVHERSNELGATVTYDITDQQDTRSIPAAFPRVRRPAMSFPTRAAHVVDTQTATGSSPAIHSSSRHKARSFTGSGVFLHPLGVTNAASYSPVTASVAPGEFVTFFGTGLASSQQWLLHLPSPERSGACKCWLMATRFLIYSVSPTQISGVLPYSLRPNDYANFTVVNNGVSSNVVTQYVNAAATGVFTNPANGLGTPARCVRISASSQRRTQRGEAGLSTIYLQDWAKCAGPTVRRLQRLASSSA